MSDEFNSKLIHNMRLVSCLAVIYGELEEIVRDPKMRETCKIIAGKGNDISKVFFYSGNWSEELYNETNHYIDNFSFPITLFLDHINEFKSFVQIMKFINLDTEEEN